MVETLYLNSDNVIEVRELVADITGDPVTGATVTCVIKTAAGVTVATVTLTEVEAGLYRGVLPYSTSLAANGRYVATITANAGDQRRREFTVPMVAQAR